ncbi:MAG: UbiA family prenyltransferase [Pirellulales bacterium]|nr:UbiA family prenyltransferase [Pirellulales bacterium]
MFLRVRQLLEMIRFSHTIFALPFALLAAVMAWTTNAAEAENLDLHGWNFSGFQLKDLLGILVCMASARSAAMAFNRLADMRIDALNPRTKERHLPAGVLSVGSVATFTMINSLVFVGGTLLFLPENRLPLYASIPVLLFLFSYSFTKRFTILSHFWLGAALMLAPLAAWVAIRGELAWAPVVLGSAVMLWVAGFDMIYACQDVDFDKKYRLRSVPARLGVAGALRMAAVCHLGTVVMLFILECVFPAFGWIYLAAVGAIATLLIYEHRLVRPDDLSRVNRAFFNVNAVISLGLFLAGTVDLLL